jgi:hypothetical protein
LRNRLNRRVGIGVPWGTSWDRCRGASDGPHCIKSGVVHCSFKLLVELVVLHGQALDVRGRDLQVVDGGNPRVEVRAFAAQDAP